jgi:hypothetical protein
MARLPDVAQNYLIYHIALLFLAGKSVWNRGDLFNSDSNNRAMAPPKLALARIILFGLYNSDDIHPDFQL